MLLAPICGGHAGFCPLAVLIVCRRYTMRLMYSREALVQPTLGIVSGWLRPVHTEKTVRGFCPNIQRPLTKPTYCGIPGLPGLANILCRPEPRSGEGPQSRKAEMLSAEGAQHDKLANRASEKGFLGNRCVSSVRILQIPRSRIQAAAKDGTWPGAAPGSESFWKVEC
jgi:hypothetical protein